MDKKYDLVVIGTGFASSFFLKKYLEKSPQNVKVLVLERGRLYAHADRLENERGNKPPYTTELKSHEDSFINTNKNKPWVFDINFGGSSNCWWGCTPRLMPNDFRIKTLYGVGYDWPLTYDEIEPYYVEAEEIMAISGPDVTPFPKSKKYPLPSHQLSTVDRILQKAHGNELYISQPTARASVPTGIRNACCTSYICNICPVNAKFTIENTLKPVYQDPRVTLVYHAQVYALDIQNNVVNSVLYEVDGLKEQAFGNVVAMGANAIFNAHILLNSGDTNVHTGAGICDQRGLFANIYLDGLNNWGGSSALTANGYMLYDGEFRKDYASCLMENHNAPIIRNEQGKWRQLARFKFVFEDLPDPSNKVVLSDNLFKPKVEYKEHSGYINKGVDNLKKNIDKIFSSLPVEKIDIDTYFQETEFHVLSTTKMSQNPEDGVLDKDLIHHKYRNLFVLGGSSFPAVSAANPSLTISALSLRTADKNF